jgi:hypothetical protein
MDPSKLFVEFLFGVVGAGYFIYGKKAGRMLFLVCGLALGLFPYFVDKWVALLLVGAALVFLPFMIKAE